MFSIKLGRRGKELFVSELLIKDEPSPEEEDYAHQYTSRLPMDQPLYQIYMLTENNKLFDGVLLRASDLSKRTSSFPEEQGPPNDVSSTSIDLVSVDFTVLVTNQFYLPHFLLKDS